MEWIQLSGCAIIKDEKLLLLWRGKQGHYGFPGGKVNVEVFCKKYVQGN
ncbi:MAG: hypothetical protein HY981_02320 [Candidatus Magasanikbacteria bacterium]|nr:hypothetical protein [Candidatus Magasanikbacteria bacterium]